MKPLETNVEEVLRKAIQAEVDAEVLEAFEFAENSPFPAPEELWTGVYAD